MEVAKLKDLIEQCFTTIWFLYKGHWGNVEPTYDSKTKVFTYAMYYHGVDLYVHDIDVAMKTPFVDGKSLEEVAEDLEDVDW